MNGKRMTKVMNTWSFTPAIVGNAGFPDKSPEVVIDPFLGVSTAVGSGKEGLFRVLHRVHCLNVGAAPCDKRRAHGNKPVFVEFAVSDSQRSVFYVYITHGQVERFRYTKPASI
jgi:hypothetical protein